MALLPALAVLACVPLCAWLHGLTPSALAWFVFHGLLIGATSLEFIRGRMPLREALLGTAAGLATAAMPWPDTSLLVERALGAGAGFAVVWLAGLAQARWQPAALGEGSLPEALLFAMAGAWFGWKALPILMLGSFVLSMLVMLAARGAAGRGGSWLHALARPRPGASAPPWGPLLAVTVVLYEVLQHAL